MGSSSIQHRLRQAMQTRYGVAPGQVHFVWSPYRICPLGAHIDHQLGTVTAMAIDPGTWLAFAPSDTPQVRLSSLAFPDEVRFNLGPALPRKAGHWGDYARGAAFALNRRTRVECGILGVTHGAVTESGLSSSASVGVAYLLAMEHVNGLTCSPAENIRLDQTIENEYLGLRNGILDQSAILLSRREHLTVIDCHAFDSTAEGAVPAGVKLIPQSAAMPPFRILIAMSGITRAILATGYNTRVAECEEAARMLLKASGRRGVAARLGNVRAQEYECHQARLSGPAARRARHFFTEMERVRDGILAWSRGDLRRFGQLMTGSGQSSIDNYECGSPPLIDLFEILAGTPGVRGARFSGAGFRGCCVALVEADAAEAAIPIIREAYARAHPALANRAACFLCDSADGARVL